MVTPAIDIWRLTLRGTPLQSWAVVTGREVAHEHGQHDTQGHSTRRKAASCPVQAGESAASAKTAEVVDGVEGHLAQAREQARTCALP